MEGDLRAAVRADLDALTELSWSDGGRGSLTAFLRDRLDRIGAVPYGPRPRAHVEGPLVAALPGREPDRRPLVLTARTDLSGVSALAGVAALLASLPGVLEARLERAVIVALFDESRPDAAGAAHWFEVGRRHDVKAALVAGRMAPWRRIGHDEVLPVAGAETDARLPDVLEGAAPAAARIWPTRHVTDGLPFAAHGVAYLRVGAAALGPGRGPRTEPADAARVAGLAAATLVTLAARLDAARLPGPYGGFDSTAYEVAATARAFGPALEALGGVPSDRAGLDRLASTLLGA